MNFASLWSGETLCSRPDKTRSGVKNGSTQWPRQAGKTTLAKQLAESYTHPQYLNYDNIEHKRVVDNSAWRSDADLLIFDELHKKNDWLNFLKGVYDTRPPEMQILVIGSARLDVFFHAGDSLAGRYFRHRLLPFTPLELSLNDIAYSLDELMLHSGFPEPFLNGDLTYTKRWRLQYTDAMLREEIFDLARITQLNKLRLLYEMLSERVGSPVSFASLARDLEVSGHTVKNYIEQLEALYIIFRVKPYSRNIARSVLKEPKIYFFDIGAVKNDSARLENTVALTLLQYTCLLEDQKGTGSTLYYLRDKEGHEVDFAVTFDSQVQFMAEVKTSDNRPDGGIVYFYKKYGFISFQLVKYLQSEYDLEGIAIRDLNNFLKKDLRQMFLREGETA